MPAKCSESSLTKFRVLDDSEKGPVIEHVWDKPCLDLAIDGAIMSTLGQLAELDVDDQKTPVC